MQNMFLNNVKIGDVKAQISRLLKSQRKKNKLSQQELADLLDLSRITIQNVESGKNYTIDTLFKVLQYFDLLRDLNEMILEYVEERENLKSLY